MAASHEDGALAILALIKKGAKTEAVDSIGRTPLHLAAQYGYINNVVTLIFEGNAKVGTKDKENKTPLHRAKTSIILDILLTKINVEELKCLEEVKEVSNEDKKELEEGEEKSKKDKGRGL